MSHLAAGGFAAFSHEDIRRHVVDLANHQTDRPVA